MCRYGEGERTLASMLQICDTMGGAIIFLDEVDALAGKRNDDMHEASRRLLGVLLRFIDGFKSTDSIVVAATNRKQDLDAAMLSRCDAIIHFDLPSLDVRVEILRLYAAHLDAHGLRQIAEATDGMSARDLRSICEVAERRWVSGIIRKRESPDSLPPVAVYLASAAARRVSMRPMPDAMPLSRRLLAKQSN